MKLSHFALLSVLILTACAAPPPPTATEAPQAVVVTVTPSVTPLPVLPTVDPLTPTAIAKFFAAHATKAAGKALTPETTSTPSFENCSGNQYLTTDGSWVLCNQYTDPIVLVNRSNQIWEFSYQSFYKQKILSPCTELLQTTANGLYLYFAFNLNCPMTEPGFEAYPCILRMNLTNGHVDEIIKASFDFQTMDGTYYSASISPTGRRLAFIRLQPPPLTLNILDIRTGKLDPILLDLKYIDGGRYQWSDDGTKLALMLASQAAGSYQEPLISFAFLDLEKADPMVVFVHDKEFFWITTMLTVTDAGVNMELSGEETSFYNSKTGVVSIIP